MPQYLFEHTKTGEVHTVVLHMNDEKVYLGPKGTDKAGVWKRVWTVPRAAVDTQYDPYSTKDFIKTTGKGGRVGDLWDRSKEAHLKRADKEGGVDPIRQQFYKDFSRKNKGRKHHEQRREDTAREVAKAGIKIDWGSDD